MKSRDLQPKLLYLAKISFRINGQTKTFPDKKEVKGFIVTKPLYEVLKGLISEKDQNMNNKMAKNTIYQQLN